MLVVLMVAGTGIGLVGLPSAYGYGETWWREYRSDDRTVLLLHFGPQQVTADQELAKEVKAKQEEEKIELDFEMFDAKATTMEGVEMLDPGEELEKQRLQPVDESKRPEDAILDYSDNRHVLEAAPENMRIIDNGKFGKGLAAEGGAVRFETSGTHFEGWFRIEQKPEKAQCLFSIGKDKTRLIMHPDGRLEILREKPHGEPYTDPNAPFEPTREQIQSVLEKDATVISPEPIPIGEWVHVCMLNREHPTPGGGSPWEVTLFVNGNEVASYLSERYNGYRWWAHRGEQLTIGNNATGEQPFTGLIDEVRVCEKPRTFIPLRKQAWKKANEERELQFGRPTFRTNADHFHASLDQGTRVERHAGADDAEIEVDFDPKLLDSITVPGVRGKGLVIDKRLGFPRVPLTGMNPKEGTLEFWFRPINWDNYEHVWPGQRPPFPHLSIARLYGRDKQDGGVKKFMEIKAPRVHGGSSFFKVDPGWWIHVAARWRNGKANGFFNGDAGGASVRWARGVDPENIEPLYVEFGINDNCRVKYGQIPLVEIDEIIGYNAIMEKDEVVQAHERWKRVVDPIPLFKGGISFRHSTQELFFSATPMLPPEYENPDRVVFSVNKDGEPFKDRRTIDEMTKGAFRTRVHDGAIPISEGKYTFDFEFQDDGGETLHKDQYRWKYRKAPWRDRDIGVVEEAPSPWTPIEVEDRTLRTRMSTCRLGENGLPRQITIDGEDVLSAPVQLLEDGAPMRGKLETLSPSRNVEADWSATFRGETLDVGMQCRIEYDGMVRYELDVQPKADEVKRVSMVIPMKAQHAKRYVYFPMGAGGVNTGVINPGDDGVVADSRVPSVSRREYKQAQRRAKRKGESFSMNWEQFQDHYRKTFRGYRFWGQFSVNDMVRGLWWFADNGAGWHQSKKNAAIEFVRADQALNIQLNLIAEPVKYEYESPIVFGLLPHPARPMPRKHRLYEKGQVDTAPEVASVYDAFRPWPKDPRKGEGMRMFPATEPGMTRWEYAESCREAMHDSVPYGRVTMYLSKLWLSCRAGAYDHWEWRTGKSGQATMTESFVQYLCWEMNEWVGRNIFNAIYLDESYETNSVKVDDGYAIKLPDGSTQPGVDNFWFRELMKRWRNLFTIHDMDPMLLAHLTGSFQYHALVFTQSYLDGEGAPVVTMKGRDWIDSTKKHRWETVNNGHLWGLSSFYMTAINESGYRGEKSLYKAWQWRMGRQCMSQMAHYEMGDTFSQQGRHVFKQYWEDLFDWGGAWPDDAEFHPYTRNDKYIDARARYRDNQEEDRGNVKPPDQYEWEKGHTGDLQVSFYKHKDGRLRLIASNRSGKNRVARIALNPEALGIPALKKAINHDGTFERPEGEDKADPNKIKEEVDRESEHAVENLLDGEGGESHDDESMLGKDAHEILTDPKELEKTRRKSWQPRLKDNTIIVPIRSKDFRAINLE